MTLPDPPPVAARMDQRPCFVIFGAAVRADGTASGSLLRRVEGAYALARQHENAVFLATGGVGRFPPAEAVVMQRILIDRGVDGSDIILDTEADDTLSSVRNCTEIIRRRNDIGPVIVCSSGYHNPRCAILLRLNGIPATWRRMPADWPHLGLLKWTWYIVREILATFWDVTLVLIQRNKSQDPA